MRLVDVTDMAEILKLVPIETKLIDKANNPYGMSLKDKLTWIDHQINKKPIIEAYSFKVLMIYGDDDEVIGYGIVSLTKANIKAFDELRIYRVWYDQTKPEVAKLFWDSVTLWAKKNNVHVVKSEADNRIKAWKRKWKMEPVSVNMRRRI